MTDSLPQLYCANHPETPTSLRCNNCEKPICPKCAVLTPTGYRCKECVRNQQKKFDNAEWYDYVITFVVGVGIAFLGSLLVYFMVRFFGWFFIFIFIAIGAAAGVVIAQAIRYVTKRRRSKALFQLAAASVLIGFLPMLLWNLIRGDWWGLLWIGIYAVSTASAVYARLRGLRL
jgi:hypothetical protein